MKALFQEPVMKFLFILLLTLPVVSSFSQARPDYVFKNARLDSGVDKTVGAVYHFSNVRTGTDAFIKIKAITGGASIQNLDRTADGYDEAFQPEINVPGGRDGYVEFQISFVKSGTSVRVSQTEIKASALDIDGDLSRSGVLYEYNQIDMGGGVYDFNTLSTQILITPIGTGFRAANITGILFGASVDTSALDVMYTVKNGSVSTFTWRTGVNNLLNTSTAKRYTSLYFKSFNYPNTVLAASKILNFEGNMSGTAVNLNWSISSPENAYNCTLEKAGDDNRFETVEGFNKKNATDYSYTDILHSSGRSLYRVKLTGPEGQVKYSNVLSFQKAGASGNEVKVYPSIVTSQQFTLNVPSERKQEGSVQLVDYSGRVVYKKTLSLNAGANSITVNDLNSSLKGNYLVVANTGGERFTNKIVIQ